MIPKHMTIKSCVGKRAVADRDISNFYGMEIRTPPCKCCGVSLRVSHVGRESLTVLEGGE